MNEQMFPAEVTVEVAGETFTLKAFPAKHLRPYLRITTRMNEKSQALGRELAAEYEAKKAAGLPVNELTDDNIPVDRLYDALYEEFLELVTVATGKPVGWVEELGIDELVTLAGIINELNSRRYDPKKAEARVMVKGVQ